MELVNPPADLAAHATAGDPIDPAVPGAIAGLSVTAVSKRFGGDAAAVDNISLSIPRGAYLVLLGPSGCGKTTLLRMIAGLEHPTGGRIDIAGTPVVDVAAQLNEPPGRRGVGMVFQSYALWPHMRVADNVEWPLKVAKVSKADRRALVQSTLRTLGIDHLASRFPGQLSGGQQQRVALARTLAARPRLLLLDEPLSNLDAALRQEMRGELARLHRTQGITVVHVTHDQIEALTLATHIAVIDAGQLVQFGTPHELLTRPASPFVARFVGSPPYTVVSADMARRASCRVADATATVAVRPENIALGNLGAGLDGVVLESSPLADRWLTQVLVEGARISVLSPSRPPLDPGEPTSLVFPQTADIEFDT